ncbi:MAG: helix-turn-helix domain-containing protein [Chloroflexota bacterium]
MSLLGERLRQAREARGVVPLQAEMDTRIRAAVIQSLEQGDYEHLPPDPFLRGLIRTYATYLGLDSEEMLGLYAADRTPPPVRPARAAATISPPTTMPEESAAPTTTLPPAEPVRKPAAIRLPSLRPPIPRPPTLKPSLPEPPAPPEAFAQPAAPVAATPAASDAPAAPISLAHSTRRPMPLPVIVAIIGGVVCICLISALIGWTQFSPIISQLAGLNVGTPTRALPTRTPTLRPGANPTAIPMLAATAPPFAPLSGSPTATLKATPRSAPETFTGLNLQVVEISQTITLRVSVDGVLVFNGQMQPGATRAWSAKESLYVEIENPKGAILEMNGNAKWFAPRTFAETKSLERQWSLNEKGTPIAVSPSPPATPSIRAPTTPTPTLTPFS